MMRPKLLILNRNLSNLYCIVLYKLNLLSYELLFQYALSVTKKTRLYVTSFWWYIVNWLKYYLRICIENLRRRLKTCIYYREDEGEGNLEGVPCDRAKDANRVRASDPSVQVNSECYQTGFHCLFFRMRIFATDQIVAKSRQELVNIEQILVAYFFLHMV